MIAKTVLWRRERFTIRSARFLRRNHQSLVVGKEPVEKLCSRRFS